MQSIELDVSLYRIVYCPPSLSRLVKPPLVIATSPVYELDLDYTDLGDRPLNIPLLPCPSPLDLFPANNSNAVVNHFRPPQPVAAMMANDDVKRAEMLKTEGNKHFTSGNFAAAEGLYSKAIIVDHTNYALYTNRAMSRLRLSMYESAVVDCHTCLQLSGPNKKAYFILSQCLLALHDFEGALENALLAYRLGCEMGDKLLGTLTAQVLRCKKERWDELEKKRSREGQALERQVISLMERERDDNLASCADETERIAVKEEYEEQISRLQATFEAARVADERRREVPDWAIDDISFGIMVDPVMTKTGKSYERASILEALRRQPLDPITREPLHPSELRPNLGLKQACDEFLDQNGWAVDW
ncbi:hypothetical protein F5B22DRAFT_50484 [Xylaria bambusicola]|uniref:uncharacterized protein n=1 Tax=Xylaria bambusicola TaxID=326684 RepID=UPI0020087AAE|nr:uncharacterized protein F5B22DRAFT_50484 [Xylaria bambusicola]KAI0520747.1 hypothetical protein F5B22DRAFT_50484 [Xylaria bambusicola]